MIKYIEVIEELVLEMQKAEWDSPVIDKAIDFIKNNKWKASDGDNKCQECHSFNPCWTCNNDLFNKINGSPNGVLCPLCFEKKANEMGENIIFKVSTLPMSYKKEVSETGAFAEPTRDSIINLIDSLESTVGDKRKIEIITTWISNHTKSIPFYKSSLPLSETAENKSEEEIWDASREKVRVAPQDSMYDGMGYKYDSLQDFLTQAKESKQ